MKRTFKGCPPTPPTPQRKSTTSAKMHSYKIHKCKEYKFPILRMRTRTARRGRGLPSHRHTLATSTTLKSVTSRSPSNGARYVDAWTKEGRKEGGTANPDCPNCTMRHRRRHRAPGTGWAVGANRAYRLAGLPN